MNRTFKVAAMLNAIGLAMIFQCAAQAQAATLDFAHDVRPILREKCYICHGPAQQMGGMRMDTKQDRLSVANGANSELVRRITSKDPAVWMPRWPTANGLTPEEIEILKRWAAEGAQGDDPPPSNARTADFLAAIDRDDIAKVRLLLKDRSLVNVTDSDGASPLMHAALYADIGCMKVLLENGADPNARNLDGATALIWAADDPAKVKLLLAAKADVNARTKHGVTALLAAALPYGSSGVIAQLLAKGADVNATDVDGWTPLIRAAASGDTESTRQLLAHHADPNGTASSLSPLTAAVWYGNLETVRLLLEKGADANARDGIKFTPLAYAAMLNRKEIAAVLLERGADVNLAIDENPQMKRSPGTPLMLAAYAETSDPQLVKFLISRGARVNFASPVGETAASRAGEKGHSPVLTALLEAGAKEPVKPTNAKARPVDPVPEIRVAVERSLALLQPADAAFFTRTGCKSCHNQSLPAMALGLAKERGFRFNQESAQRQSDTVAEALKSQRERMWQSMDDEGPPLSGAYALAGLAATGYPANDTTAAFVKNIAARQLPAGNWHPAGARPPIEYSDVPATAWAIRAIRLYGQGRRAPQYEVTVGRARKWLSGVQPQSTDERTFQLFGLYWAKSDTALLKSLAAALLAEQRTDGGWAQLPALSSDAYATGQVLYALNQAGGLSTSDPAYQRGVTFLRETQMEDGSWLVESHAIAIQKPLDAKFPHGANQFISVAGTSWASMALMLTQSRQVR